MRSFKCSCTNPVVQSGLQDPSIDKVDNQAHKKQWIRRYEKRTISMPAGNKNMKNAHKKGGYEACAR